MTADKNTWLRLARRQHDNGQTRRPEVRAQIRAMLKDDWPRFAQECGLDPDPDAPPVRPILPVTTFQHVLQPPMPPLVHPPPGGPGTALAGLLARLGVQAVLGCGCADYARLMDEWQAEGCLSKRQEIISWLKKGIAEQTWGTVLKATGKGLGIIPLSALAGGVDGVFGWLVDESIRRASSPEA